MKKVLYLIIIFCLAPVVRGAVVGDKPFRIVYQTNQRGGIVYLSNVGVKCLTKDTMTAPPSTNVDDNIKIKSKYVDIDKNPTTFMSSADSLKLPDCSGISYVGLFWGGTIKAETPGFSERSKIKISYDNGEYSQITADSLTDYDETSVINWGRAYHCYADITSLFLKKGGKNGKWTIANLVTDTTGYSNTIFNRWSGWNMVIVYKNESENLRQLTVFEGLVTNNVSTTLDVPVTGFLTPTEGSVSFELGTFGYDGDRNYAGDRLWVGVDADHLKLISDASNPDDNIFNSTISRNGVLSKTCVPYYKNNYSIDADIFIPSNGAAIIGNGVKSFIMRTATVNEAYRTHEVSLAIDSKIHDNRLGMRVEDLNGGFVEPGDILEYTLVGNNVGSDHSVDTYITNEIEKNAVYVPNSIRITYGENIGAKTDASNDDQAEFIPATNSIKVRIGTGANAINGGEVVNSPSGADSTVVKFRVTVAVKSNVACEDLLCDNIVNNHAYIHGTGKDSGIKTIRDQVPQQFDNSTCSVEEISNKTSVIVYTNCPDKKATLVGSECAGSDLELQGPVDNNATYEWSGPNKFSSYDRVAFIKNTKPIDSGDYVLKMINSVTNCHSYFIIKVKVNEGSIADAGKDQSICSTSTKLIGNAPSSGNGQWTLIQGNASDVVISSATSSTTDVSFSKSGIYKFKWELPDAGCTTIPDEVTIRVGLDCPPILDNENHVINIGEKAEGDLTDVGDASQDGKPLVVNTTPTTNPKNGGILIQSDGSYTYTPNNGFAGKDTVIVEICQQTLPQCASDTIFITVLAPLTLDNETHVIKPNQTATGDLTNAGDISYNNTFVVNTTPIVGPKHGGITIKSDGTYTYTPASGYLGKDTVIVNICDQQIPKQCKNDTIFITIEQNTPIVIKNETNIVDECKTVGGNIIDLNDVIYLNKPVIVPETDRATKLGGKFTVDAQGVYSYKAPCGKSGNDTIVVNVCDTQTPKQCKNDTLFITVNPMKPVAVEDLNVPTSGKLDSNDSPTSGVENYWYVATGDTPKDDRGQTVGTVSIDPKTSEYIFTPYDPNFEGTVTFHYYIVDDNKQVSNVVAVTIIVLPIWIPEGFSPNGDGDHDKFVITNFSKERYKNNTINIFNRWGNKVYVAHPYDNEWDGTNNQGLSVGGNVLPVGTYFYILDLGTGLKPFRGYVYLSR